MRIGTIPRDELLIEEIRQTWNAQRACLNLMCSKIDEDADTLDDELSKIAENSNDLNEVLTYQENMIAMYEDFYRGIDVFWNSFYVSSYSLFEYQMVRMCHRVRDSHPEKKSPKKVDSVTKAKAYLKEACVDVRVISDGDRNLWCAVDNYRKFRNRIVHHDGRIRPTGRYFEPAADLGIVSGLDDYCQFKAEFGEGTKESFNLSLDYKFCTKVLSDYESFALNVIQMASDTTSGSKSCES